MTKSEDEHMTTGIVIGLVLGFVLGCVFSLLIASYVFTRGPS